MKHLITLFLALLLATGLHAQTPQRINYQAILRDAGGAIQANTTATLGLAILQGSASGAVVYNENHSVTTNGFGLANVAIGAGTIISGSMAAIDWSEGPYFVRTSVNGTPLGTSQLLSVPYALFAETSNTPGPQGPQGEEGPAGPQGVQGVAGTPGATGSQGPAGATGPQGPAGPQGPQGDEGPAGADGTGVTILGTLPDESQLPPTGNPGDAYLIDGSLYVWSPTTNDWTNSGNIQGPAGLQGPQGVQGPAGAAGAAGATGATGPQGSTGPQGTPGTPGAAGTDGRTVLSGATNPTAGTGANGDFYINTAANTLFGPKTGGAWGTGVSLVGPQGAMGAQGTPGATGATGATGPQGNPGTNGAPGAPGATGPQGLPGPTGETGPQGLPGTNGTDGTNGTNGVDGRTVLNGATNPAAGNGANGDFYINTAANTLFGPKTGGAWGAGVSLVGPTGTPGSPGTPGTPGTDGTNGLDGRTVLNGTTDPANTVGENGDFYINTTTYFLFGPKANDIWNEQTAISLVGPEGPGGAGGWSLTGNAGTTPATNFLGTTDAQPLNFRANNIIAGTVNQATRNTALGSLTFNASPTGNWNSALGYNALRNLTTGAFNLGAGGQALRENTTGYDNSALGTDAMVTNTTGYRNTAVGAASLYLNTTGFYNLAAGVYALYENSTGYSNVAVGVSALKNNQTRSNNVAVGDSALFSNDNGLPPYTPGGIDPQDPTGFYNTAVGSKALYGNGSGFRNTAVGQAALYTNSSGYYNTAVGASALSLNSNGLDNTAIGRLALGSNTAGSNNSALGEFALYDNSSGSFNTAAGHGAGPNAATRSNTTALGYEATCTAGNQARIGNSAVTSIGGYAGWTTLPSDARFKSNILTDVSGLDFILRLRPVTYNVNVHALATHLGEDQRPDANGNMTTVTPGPEMLAARNEKAAVRYTGFIAQEVDAAAKAVGYDFSGVDKAKEGDDMLGLRYAEFVVPLVKAVQEQQAIIDQLLTRVKELEAAAGK